MTRRDFNYDPASDGDYDDSRHGMRIQQGKTCECVPTCYQCDKLVGEHGPKGECPDDGGFPADGCVWDPRLPEAEYVETQRQTWNDPACGENYCTECGRERETDDPMNYTDLKFNQAEGAQA